MGSPAPGSLGSSAVLPSQERSPEELREEYVRLKDVLAQEPEVAGHHLLLCDLCLRMGRSKEGREVAVQITQHDPHARGAVLDVLRRHLDEAEIARLPLGKELIPFYLDAASVLRYPLRGNGPVLLVGGAAVFTGLTILSRITTVFFWIPALFILGYLASYAMTVIDHTGRGQEEPPDYPDYDNFTDSVMGPFWIAFSAAAIPSILPVAYISLWGADFGLAPFVALGLCYWPMAMIAGSAFQTPLAPLDFLLVVRAIRITAREYLPGVAVIYGMALTNWAAQLLMEEFLPSVMAWSFAEILGLYFLMTEMYVLGRIYRNHERALGWFKKQRPVRSTPAGGPPAPAASAGIPSATAAPGGAPPALTTSGRPSPPAGAGGGAPAPSQGLRGTVQGGPPPGVPSSVKHTAGSGGGFAPRGTTGPSPTPGQGPGLPGQGHSLPGPGHGPPGQGSVPRRGDKHSTPPRS